MSIITYSGKQRGKVAKEVSNKGYCASKSLFYHGVKSHFLTLKVAGTLPFPEGFIVTAASESDLNIFRDSWSSLVGKVIFGDKTYQDKKI